jgi:Zn-dependent protease with chaperone function
MPATALDFMHPEDKAALENLQSLPLFSQCLKAFMKMGIEQQLHGLNLANKIRLGPDQLPEIYSYLPPVCEKLGIALPDFYLEMNPMPNAYTQGDTRIFVTVTSGLVEYLQPEEIRAVISHECGHIVCHHVLYHTLAAILATYGSGALGLAGVLTAPIQLALAYWSRRSELSADRAAALVMGGAQPVVETMIRLAGGPRSITSKVNIEAYLTQAESYDKLKESNWDKVLQSMAIMQADHPFASVRSREITQWCGSEYFERLQRGIAAEETAPKCPGCGAALGEGWRFCRQCGMAIG